MFFSSSGRNAREDSYVGYRARVWTKTVVAYFKSDPDIHGILREGGISLRISNNFYVFDIQRTVHRDILL